MASSFCLAKSVAKAEPQELQAGSGAKIHERLILANATTGQLVAQVVWATGARFYKLIYCSSPFQEPLVTQNIISRLLELPNIEAGRR